MDINDCLEGRKEDNKLNLTGFVLSLFLYFPEDKSEYIPATFWMIVTFIAAIFVMRLFVKISKKEAQKAKEFEQTFQQSGSEEKNS